MGLEIGGPSPLLDDCALSFVEIFRTPADDLSLGNGSFFFR